MQGEGYQVHYSADNPLQLSDFDGDNSLPDHEFPQFGSSAPTPPQRMVHISTPAPRMVRLSTPSTLPADPSLPPQSLLTQYLQLNLTNPNSLTLKPGVSSIEYLSESTYIGQTANNSKSGKGAYKYSNGDVYMGDWQEDKFHGRGMYVFGNGDRFVGEFVKGDSTKGSLFYSTGAVYEGGFVGGCRHGYGVMREYRKTAKLGQAVVEREYSGQWREDVRHGEGTYRDAETTIEAIWEDDQVNGHAKVNGAKDQGKFHYAGIMSGSTLIKGTLKIIYSNQQQIQGPVFHNKFQGRVIYTCSPPPHHTPTLYTLLYKQGLLSNLSTISTSPPSLQYTGQVHPRTLVPEGQGSMAYPNGDVYEGQFREGVRHGRGRYRWASGRVWEGLWQGDQVMGASTGIH